MNPTDAIKAINLLPEQAEELFECLRTNKAEASMLLFAELEEVISSVVTLDKLSAKNVNCILVLISKFQMKEAFCCLDNVLENNKVSCFENAAVLFANAVCNCVTDADLPKLKEYVFTNKYDDKTRFVAYSAVKTLLYTNKCTNANFSSEEFHSFISEVLGIYPQLDTSMNHTLLSCLFADCCDVHTIKMQSEMKALLIKLIVENDADYNSNCFQDYFKWLYQIEPTIAHTVQEIWKYVTHYNKQVDKDIFECLDLQSVGKCIFHKVVAVVESATVDVVKLAVKQMHHYPHNNRPEPVTDDEYYSEICVNAGILQLPKVVFEQSNVQYNDIFIVAFTNLSSSINDRKGEVENKKQSFKTQQTDIVDDNNRNGKKIDFDIRHNIDRLGEIELNIKRCEAELELLTFYERQIKKTKDLFCENYNDSDLIDTKLKELSCHCISSSVNDVHGIKICDYFDYFKRVKEQINLLIGSADSTDSIDLIFYKIVFLPFIRRFEKKALPTNMDAELYKTQISEHPLNLTNITEVSKDTSKYVALLGEYADQAIANIRRVLSESIAIDERKGIIEKCIGLFIDEEYEFFVNAVPIQIEGMFADLQRSMVFDLFADIEKLHPKAVLREKIDILNHKGANLFFEVEAYFKYYFNSLIRNTVAHGNYKLLSIVGGSYHKLALELLFSLNYFVDTLFSINELDAMNEYINSAVLTYEDTKENHLEISYDCLFSDLNGTRECLRRSEYKSGLFKTYDPKQILWWIFNPYYESFCRFSDKLLTLRIVLKSVEFWKHIEDKLKTPDTLSHFDKDDFKIIISIMLSSSADSAEIKNVLIEINKLLR
ncbi:hypothetical protein FACS1894216_05240 [Synergistales bacterium]|nr:hypothetical protein FACS1894216_05240 [Synergistales bacterium]